MIDALRYWFGKVVKLEFEVHTYFFLSFERREIHQDKKEVEEERAFSFFTHQEVKGENLINNSVLHLLLLLVTCSPFTLPISAQTRGNLGK